MISIPHIVIVLCKCNEEKEVTASDLELLAQLLLDKAGLARSHSAQHEDSQRFRASRVSKANLGWVE